MVDMIVSDVAGILRSVFLSGDWLSLAIAFGSVLVAALVMRRASQIGAMTLLALVLFVVGCFVRGFFRTQTSTEAAAGAQAANRLERVWLDFMGLEAGVMIAYFLAFMLLIFVVFGLKSVFARG